MATFEVMLIALPAPMASVLGPCESSGPPDCTAPACQMSIQSTWLPITLTISSQGCLKAAWVCLMVALLSSEA